MLERNCADGGRMSGQRHPRLGVGGGAPHPDLGVAASGHQDAPFLVEIEAGRSLLRTIVRPLPKLLSILEMSFD